MYETRKSLRRKPPPCLSDIRTSYDTNASFEQTQSQDIHYNRITSKEKVKEQVQDLLPPLDLRVERSSDDFGDTTYDELILNISTIRAKGPQGLPPEQYFVPDKILPDEHSSSFIDLSSIEQSPASILIPRDSQWSPTRKSMASSKIQNLLQIGNSPLDTLTNEESTPYGPKICSVSPSSRKSLPFPIDNFTNYDDGEISPNLSGFYELRDQVQGMPTRIPTLVGQEPMQRSHIDIPNSSNVQSNEYYILRSSPPLFQTSLASSPELPSRYTQRSPSCSPSKSYTQRESCLLSLSPPSDKRSSPSSSPKKFSLMSQVETPVEEEFQDLYEKYSEDRYPEWSLIEYDQTDYYDHMEPHSRIATFDFSVLPELPRESLHTRRSSDALSLFISKQILPPPAPIATAKKYGELPPVPSDLASLEFSISLTGSHFLKCKNVWSLTAIFQWCLELSSWGKDLPILSKDLEKILTKLLVHHKPDVSVDIIERNVKQLMRRLMESGSIVTVSEANSSNCNVVFDPSKIKEVNGVLVELCPCYSINESTYDGITASCYSWSCPVKRRIAHEKFMRAAAADDIILGSDWASHWNLAAQEISLDPTGSKKQSYLFDLIKFEQTFVARGNCFIDVAGPVFIKGASSYLGQSSSISILKLKEEIFDSASTLVSIHQENLLNPLKNILIIDGKFIRDVKGMANLYFSWSKAAQKPLLQYMSVLPTVEDLLSNESMKGWDLTILNSPRLKEQQVNGNLLLLSTFNSRYQQLPLQLLDIRRFYEEDEEEYVALTKAVESIKELGTKVNEMKVHADNIHSLRHVEKHLLWKPSVARVNLKLSSPNRKFYFRGNLVRKGDLKINSTAVHVIVLDNYLLIAEKQRSNKSAVFKVTETPIPIEFLLVENRTTDSQAEKSASQVTGATEQEEESSAFPFKIRYAGRGKSQTHTLIASAEADRKKWLSIILQARYSATKKLAHMAPFAVVAIDDSFFAYDHNSRITRLPLLASNDPLLVITKHTRDRLKQRNIPADLFSSEVTKTQLLHSHITYSETFAHESETFAFLGLNMGIYCSDGKNIWKRIVSTSNVTKITVIPELSVVLVLANKELRYYALKALVDLYYERKEKLSFFILSSGNVLFFDYGRHREVPTLFVARKKNSGTTTFKVLALETDNDGIFSTFSVIKRFYIQAECYGVSIFNTSVAVHTNRGFEVLDLEKLVPRTVPELPPSDLSAKKIDVYSRKKDGSGVDHIRKALAHTTPMGMYRLSNNKEFLLVYTDCAIFVNKNGKLSRKQMICFEFRPRSCAFADNHLIVACEEVVEVWNISDFTSGTNNLVQVLPCKDIHMTNKYSLEFRSANPRMVGVQLLFRLVNT